MTRLSGVGNVPLTFFAVKIAAQGTMIYSGTIAAESASKALTAALNSLDPRVYESAGLDLSVSVVAEKGTP